MMKIKIIFTLMFLIFLNFSVSSVSLAQTENSTPSISSTTNVQQILKDHFDIVPSNENWDKAQVILLGDINHEDTKQQNFRISLINQMIKELQEKELPFVPVLLLEGLDSSEVIDSKDFEKILSLKNISPEVIVGGWDHIEKFNKVLEAFKVISKEYEEFEILQVLSKKNSDQVCKNGHRSNLSSIMKDFKIINDSTLLMNYLAKKILARFNQNESTVIKDRNENMLEVIKILLDTKLPMKLFIISGNGHFNFKESSKIDPKFATPTFLKENNIPYSYFKSKITSPDILAEQNIDPAHYLRKLVATDRPTNSHGTSDKLIKAIELAVSVKIPTRP